jgi:hypothetical protein
VIPVLGDRSRIARQSSIRPPGRRVPAAPWWYDSGMKKSNHPRKLTLNRDTVKTLRTADLVQVAAGATNPCNQPTTTVQRTFDC